MAYTACSPVLLNRQRDTASDVQDAALLVPSRLFVVVVWSVIKSVFFSHVCSTLTMLSVRVCQLDKQTPLCITTCCHAEGRGRRCVCLCVRARLWVCVCVSVLLGGSHADINSCTLLHHSTQGLAVLPSKKFDELNVLSDMNNFFHMLYCRL